jgi:hypothetical protein
MHLVDPMPQLLDLGAGARQGCFVQVIAKMSDDQAFDGLLPSESSSIGY